MEPIVIVRGQPLEVEVSDALDAPLPSDCRIHYRLAGAQGKTRIETEPMRPLGKVMVARRENVTGPLEFSLTGGDDRQALDPGPSRRSAPAPAVRSLTLRITPPAYTNWPEEEREAASTRPILAGSRVRLAGKATKRLKPRSTLRLDDGRVFPLQIDADGRSFHAGGPPVIETRSVSEVLPAPTSLNRERVPLRASTAAAAGILVEKSTAYAFRLVNVDGVEGGGDETWRLPVLADAPPSVVVDQPAGDIFVTERAVVGFRVRAGDDMALREVVLALSPSDAKATTQTTISLFLGPDKQPPLSAAAFDGGETGQRMTFDRSVDLSKLPLRSGVPLAPGVQLTCSAAATDYHSQTSRSDPRVLTVITPEQLLERMSVRQSQLLAELARVLQLQRDTRSQVRMIEIRLRETAGLEQSDIDRLQSAEFSQREVVRGLTSPSDGLPALVQGLLADLETNRLDNPDFQRRLERLSAESARLQQEQFPAIASALTAAVKGSLVRLQSSPRPAGRDAETQSQLVRAGEHQQEVIVSLEGLLAQWRQWDDYRRFHREVAQLFRDQEDVARDTTALGARTLGRDLKELTPQESADVKVLAERQLELARRQARLEQEMEQTAAALGQSEPLAAATLADAVAEARRLAIAADMTTVGGRVRDNALGLAPADQQRILQNMQEVLDILANNRRQELGRLARKLGEADSDLAALRKRQEGLRRKIDKTAGEPASQDTQREEQRTELRKLAEQQEELRRQAEQLGRRLERLLAEEAADAAGRAAERMDQGRRAGNAGDCQGASRERKGAEDALTDASRKLREKRLETEVQLAMEQQARFQDAIQHLRRQEEQVSKETREFADLERGGPLSRAQIAGLLELARQQGLLRDETGRVMGALDPANVSVLRWGPPSRKWDRPLRSWSGGRRGRPRRRRSRTPSTDWNWSWRRWSRRSPVKPPAGAIRAIPSGTTGKGRPAASCRWRN